MHAGTLRLRLRKVMLLAAAAPAIAACGGAVIDDTTGGDGGNPPDAATGCTATRIDGSSGSCGGFQVELSSAAACGVPPSTAIPHSVCQKLCGDPNDSYCTFDTATDVLDCSGICMGRFPAGLRVAPGAAHEQAGELLARVAYLEAASVGAFDILAAELRAHGAPESLERAARRAAADEVRHARVTGALARAYGGEPRTPHVDRAPVRHLAAIAMENAVEGCVRETFGALVAAWQAERAADPRVRDAMRGIARDETRHAALGWRVAAWAEARLSPEDRARVEEARRRAIDELESSEEQPTAETAGVLGLPSASERIAMVRAMRAEVWS